MSSRSLKTIQLLGAGFTLNLAGGSNPRPSPSSSEFLNPLQIWSVQCWLSLGCWEPKRINYHRNW